MGSSYKKLKQPVHFFNLKKYKQWITQKLRGYIQVKYFLHKWDSYLPYKT